MNTNLLNRKKYRELKKMDRNQMEIFFRTVYEQGYVDALKDGNQDIDSGRDFIIHVLQQTKGVGEKTIAKILDAFDEEVRRVKDGLNEGTKRED